MPKGFHFFFTAQIQISFESERSTRYHVISFPASDGQWSFSNLFHETRSLSIRHDNPHSTSLYSINQWEPEIVLGSKFLSGGTMWMRRRFLFRFLQSIADPRWLLGGKWINSFRTLRCDFLLSTQMSRGGASFIQPDALPALLSPIE